MSDDPKLPDTSHQPLRQSIRSWGRHHYREWVAAVRFLSVLPMPGTTYLFDTNEAEPRFYLGSAYFPLVGLVLGAILFLFATFVGPVLPHLAFSALLVVALLLLTGGLHLDGLMDTCDGLFGGRDREHKLTIMRDSRVGSFGVLGGASVLLLKFAFFASFSNLHQLALAFLFVLPISRWAMVLAIFCFPSARPTGLGAAARQTVSLQRLLIAAILSFALSLVLGHLAGLLVWFIGSLVALLLGFRVTSILGGLTGDVYGTIAEIIEGISLLLLIILHF